jgi:hypothetical protein
VKTRSPTQAKCLLGADGGSSRDARKGIAPIACSHDPCCFTVHYSDTRGGSSQMAVWRGWVIAFAMACVALATPHVACAWGNTGHRVIALIALDRLTPAARARIDGLLQRDSDHLVDATFDGWATWADAYRLQAPGTESWHFIALEISGGSTNADIAAACHGLPPLSPGALASEGPVDDCIVNKLTEFVAELRDPRTSDAETIVALKFLIHFVGDIHQPMHVADNHDSGGNCVRVTFPGAYSGMNLHSYWDTFVVWPTVIGTVDSQKSPILRDLIAGILKDNITDAKTAKWTDGLPDDLAAGTLSRKWALESFAIAQSTAYDHLPVAARCGDDPPVALSPEYQASARAAAMMQLEKAGVRLAFLLNMLLDPAFESAHSTRGASK